MSSASQLSVQPSAVAWSSWYLNHYHNSMNVAHGDYSLSSPDPYEQLAQRLAKVAGAFSLSPSPPFFFLSLSHDDNGTDP